MTWRVPAAASCPVSGRVRAAAILFAAYLGLYAAAVPFARLNALLIVGGFHVGPLAAIALTAWATLRAYGRARAGWGFLLAFAVTWEAAEIMHSVFRVLGEEGPYPGPQDVLYYVGYVFFLAAVPLLTARAGRMVDRRVLLDAGVVVVVSGVLLWKFVVIATWNADEGLGAAVATGYTLFDLALVAMLVTTFYRDEGRYSPVVMALVASALSTVVGDLLFLLGLGSEDTARATYLDVPWLGGYCFAGLAALFAIDEVRPSRARPRSGQSLPGLVLPYAVLLPLGAAVLWETIVTGTSRLLVTGGAAAACLLMLRQWLTLLENRRLYRALRAESDERDNLLTELAERTAELERLRRETQRIADHDALTGLLNRRAWFAAAAAEGPTAVAIFDIDHFKRVNDTYGHPAGDHVLREVAWRLGGLLGKRATVGRLGGEEFAVFTSLPWEQAASACREVVETIALLPIVLPDGQRLEVTISAGLARWLAAAGGADEAAAATYHAADLALYAAKEGGRNRLVLSAADGAAAAAA